MLAQMVTVLDSSAHTRLLIANCKPNLAVARSAWQEQRNTSGDESPNRRNRNTLFLSYYPMLLSSRRKKFGAFITEAKDVYLVNISNILQLILESRRFDSSGDWNFKDIAQRTYRWPEDGTKKRVYAPWMWINQLRYLYWWASRLRGFCWLHIFQVSNGMMTPVRRLVRWYGRRDK